MHELGWTWVGITVVNCIRRIKFRNDCMVWRITITEYIQGKTIYSFIPSYSPNEIHINHHILCKRSYTYHDIQNPSDTFQIRVQSLTDSSIIVLNLSITTNTLAPFPG